VGLDPDAAAGASLFTTMEAVATLVDGLLLQAVPEPDPAHP